MGTPENSTSTDKNLSWLSEDSRRFIEKGTGKTAEELLAMSYPERRAALSFIGVNLPENPPKPLDGKRTERFNG